MTTSSSYDWIREIDPNLKKLDSIPLTGTPAPFPWDEFSARLARSFDREGLRIQPGEISWRSKDQLYEGLGDSLSSMTFVIPSLQGQLAWVMPSQEIPILAAQLLTQDSHPLSLQDTAFNESFYHFVALEALYHFTQVFFDQSLSPILTNQTRLPDQDALCWNIALHLPKHTIWGRLVISPEFRHSWVEHFAQRKEATPLAQEMAQLVSTTVHLEAGKTQLTLAEWKKVRLGDLIILDSCSLDADKLTGRVMLTVQGKPAFRAKLKDGTLKILELPLLHEAETFMAKQPEDEHNDNSDFDLNEEEEEDLDDDLFSETDDDLFTEDGDKAEETSTTSEQESTLTKEEAPPSEVKQGITPEQIPVTLVIEVGQVKMTMEQLLKLEPGNLLEINLRAEDGVDLTINGKMVGKGELIRIGEAIGVRVLQLGR